MDGLTPTITDDARDRSLERSGIVSFAAAGCMVESSQRRIRPETHAVDTGTSKRWNLADELARRRSLGKTRALADVVPAARSGSSLGCHAQNALASLTDGWLLPPAWPLDGWRESALERVRALIEVRLVAPARMFGWPRWRGVGQRMLMFGAAISITAAAALIGWRIGTAPTQAKSSSALAKVAVPARKLLLSPLPMRTTVAPTARLAAPSLVAQAPATTTRRPFADVSTMDLMMPIAEPDLDISSGRSLWAQVGESTGVDPLLLYSIALVESKALNPDGDVVPTPWLFRVNDRVVRGDRQDVQLAMAEASQFGSAVPDVGIMQVYYPMHRDAVRDPLTLLNPRTNITVAAKILREDMHQTRDRVLGVGYYHSHTPELARDYGTLVLSVYQRLKVIYRPAADQEIVAR